MSTQTTWKNTGLLPTHAENLIQRARYLVDGIGTHAAEIEERYRPLLATDDLTAKIETTRTALHDFTDAVFTKRALIAKMEVDQTNELTMSNETAAAEKATTLATLDAEIAALEEQLRTARTKRIETVKDFSTKKKAVQAEVKAKYASQITTLDTEADALTDALGTAHQSLSLVYDELLNLAQANWNEPSKKASLKDIVWVASRARAATSSSTTKSTTTTTAPAAVV